MRAEAELPAMHVVTRIVSNQTKTTYMLHYAIVFLIIALLAGILGFGVIAGTAAMIAKVCFVIFLVFAVLSFVRRA
jgi:uncharacterized membrane protein YtjA (UPF0391 family)